MEFNVRPFPKRSRQRLAFTIGSNIPKLNFRLPATVTLSRASETMDKVDLWHAHLAMKTLRKDQRAAIAAAEE